ncbi:MAG: DUF4271 domain-containing protein [Bacteroidales bacterium]|nr:DUF4271 domain-containing protein [Bacteroidales bacterium]
MKGVHHFTAGLYYYQDTLLTVPASVKVSQQDEGQTIVGVDSTGIPSENVISGSRQTTVKSTADSVPRTRKKPVFQTLQAAKPPAEIISVQADIKPKQANSEKVAWKTYFEFNSFLYNDSTELLSREFKDSAAMIPAKQFVKSPSVFKEKFSSNIDWVFWIFIMIAFLFVWIKVFYKKYIYNLFNAVISFYASTRLFNEKNLMITRVSLVLNFIFVLSVSLVLLKISNFYNKIPETFDKASFFLIILNVLILYMVLKTLIIKLIGYIFLQGNLVNDYLHNANIYNKILGIVLIPFLFATFYTDPEIAEILLYVMVVIYFLSLVFKIIRGFQIIIKYDIFIFYSILYLCTLEILPLIIGYKFINSLY